jgi:hypothetical protein
MFIDARVLKGLARQSEPLRTALISHEHALAAHTQQVAACNALHELEERLSRWLLQSRDLIRSDTLPLTQEFLSQMLGVQRSSVTLVARKLQEAGLINYRRGRIHVLDIEGLQDSCCECYAAINGHFHRLTGWSPDGKSIAFELGSGTLGKLAVVDVATGKVRTLLSLHYAPTASWSPDSNELVANSVPRSQKCWSTWRVPVDGSSPTLISTCSS